MSKQTAVQWLIEQTRTPEWKSLKRSDILDKAIEMEKQQIVDAYLDGTLQFDNAAEIVRPKEAPMYYNENYGGDQ